MGLVPSNYGLLRNARQYQNQRLGPRGGMIAISTTPFSQLQVHSIRKLNDVSAGSTQSKRVYGVGTSLFLGEGTSAIDTGYSGNPISLLPYQPDQSPQAWMYVADRNKMRKVRIDGLLHPVGFPPPLAAPTVGFGPDVFLAISSFAAIGGWSNAGTAGTITEVARFSGNIGGILYDNIVGPGFACIWPGNLGGISVGALLTLNTGSANQEQILVSQIRQGYARTTIAGIDFDSGTTGLCTITLQNNSTVASSNLNATSDVIGNSIRTRSNAQPRSVQPRSGVLKAIGAVTEVGGRGGRVTNPGRNPSPRTPSTQSLGLQPDMLLRLTTGLRFELVRVLSVSIGPDGTTSFRCSCVTTPVAGSSFITGLACVRAYTKNVHIAGESVLDGSLASTIGNGTGTLTLNAPFNLTTAPPNAIQETDTISISLLMDTPQNLTEAKLMFDVDEATNDFTRNYFYAVMRQSDTQQAVVSQQTASQARLAALTNSLGGSIAQQPKLYSTLGPVSVRLTGDYPEYAPGGTVAKSKQAGTGAFQWTQFSCKVSDLVRVGTDIGQTLANVGAIRIQIQCTGQINLQVADLWIGGTYGPDVGTTASPYFYRIRNYSKLTGARSLAGPATRSGIEPKSQQIAVQIAAQATLGVDTIDVFRWGGTLLQWTYVGSTPNANGTFLDDLSDTSIAVNPSLEVDQFQPFPTVDLPRSGICSVVGTKVRQVSGDLFNSQWYPGSQININGTYYTIYSQPIVIPSGFNRQVSLETVENIGTLTNVPWYLTQATILGVPLPYFWGPYAEGSASFFFACGDYYQPGVLFLTNGNNPDAASDTLQTYVSSPSEPLMNGCIFDGTPYAWTNRRFFRLFPNLGSTVTTPTPLDPNATQLFIPQDVGGGKGLFANWAFCVGTKIHYLAEDGIYQSDGQGSGSITDNDLYLLFPHDGQDAQAITVGSITVNPPNMKITNALKLAEIDGFVYFDYVDTTGNQVTLVYSIITKTWSLDQYTPQVVTHYQDEGIETHAMILGSNTGLAFTSNGSSDGDGNPFGMDMRMPQLSELAGGYEVPIDGFMGLLGSQNGTISLVVNVDGVDNLISVPITTSYKRVYQRLNALKGKILAFGLSSAFPFELVQRDTQFSCGAWGRSEQATPINPFSDLRRSQAPKVQ